MVDITKAKRAFKQKNTIKDCSYRKNGRNFKKNS